MRRAKHAAMLLTMAAGLGWSGPAADARASRSQPAATPIRTLEMHAAPARVVAKRVDENVFNGDGEWRYIATRR